MNAPELDANQSTAKHNHFVFISLVLFISLCSFRWNYFALHWITIMYCNYFYFWSLFICSFLLLNTWVLGEREPAKMARNISPVSYSNKQPAAKWFVAVTFYVNALPFALACLCSVCGSCADVNAKNSTSNSDTAAHEFAVIPSSCIFDSILNEYMCGTD